MSKMLLIIDDPEMCGRCPFVGGTGSIFKPRCSRTNRGVKKYWSKSRPKWCPLISEPERINIKPTDDAMAQMAYEGWNACVDSLEKKK